MRPRPRPVTGALAALATGALVMAVLVFVGCTSSKSASETGATEATEQAGTTVAETTLPETDVLATGTGASDDTDPPAGTDLTWTACDDEIATDPSLECATLTVPLDYDDPAGPTLGIALVRVPASGARRDGAILFNPGGPGGSGFDYIAKGGPTIVAELSLDHFDLIGFDPRGVDRSNGIRCLTDEQIDQYAYIDDTPDTPEEEQALDDSESAFSTACVKQYGATLRLYSTANTARDMDAIRAALGDEQISYLGISYGTYLGAVYATLFPGRVRAMALDSAFEPTGDTVEQQYTTQLVGFEHAFDDWASWCEGTDECPFRTDDVGAAWDALLQQLDDNPVPNGDGRLGNQVVMQGATVAALYSRTDWPVLADALVAARDGDPAGLFRLADAYNGRKPDGSYSTIEQSNAVINCASGFEPEVPDDPDALVAKLRELAPRFGADIEASDLTEGDGCAELMPPQPIDTLAYRGDAPVVVVGGANDPATPFRWAEEMTDAMGSNAVLVTYNGEGHGQLLASRCVTEIEADLLAGAELPDAGTTCDPDPEIEKPAWWDSIPIPSGIDEPFESAELDAALGLSPTLVYADTRTSDLQPAGVLASFEEALDAEDYELLGEQEPIEGVRQHIYVRPTGGEILSVLAIGADGFGTPDLEGVGELVPPDKTLVVVLFIPQ